MQTLPIQHVLPEVKEKLLANTRLVLQAPPGAGKTTALPLALLDEPWLTGKKIIMLDLGGRVLGLAQRAVPAVAGEFELAAVEIITFGDIPFDQDRIRTLGPGCRAKGLVRIQKILFRLGG